MAALDLQTAEADGTSAGTATIRGLAAIVSSPKTCSNGVAPHLTAAELTALLAIAPENMTVGQLQQLADAVKRVSTGGDPATVIGSILT